MTDTAIAKYERPMGQPVGKVEQMSAMLHTYESQMAALLPTSGSVTTAKIISTALQAAIDNRNIVRCTGVSILTAVKTGCEFGLSFSKQLGQAYLVPYKTTCTLIIGYKGLLDLIRRAAGVTHIDCDVVYKGEQFEYHKGTDPHLDHVPNVGTPRKPDDIVAFYSVAFYEDDDKPSIEVMTKAQVDQIRARSKASDKGPWVTDYAQMGRKTVLRRHANYLPISAEKAKLLERALAHDNETAGLAQLNGSDVSSDERFKALESRLDKMSGPEAPDPDDAPPPWEK